MATEFRFEVRPKVEVEAVLILDLDKFPSPSSIQKVQGSGTEAHAAVDLSTSMAMDIPLLDHPFQ